VVGLFLLVPCPRAASLREPLQQAEISCRLLFFFFFFFLRRSWIPFLRDPWLNREGMQVSVRKDGTSSHVPTTKEHVLIRKAVLENTHSDGSPSAEAAQGLVKFLKNPATVDVGAALIPSVLHYFYYFYFK
jgi:hypothetical protein